jgi:hypothetical protein
VQNILPWYVGYIRSGSSEISRISRKCLDAEKHLECRKDTAILEIDRNRRIISHGCISEEINDVCHGGHGSFKLEVVDKRS